MDSLDDINEIVNKWCDTFSDQPINMPQLKQKGGKSDCESELDDF